MNDPYPDHPEKCDYKFFSKYLFNIYIEIKYPFLIFVKRFCYSNLPAGAGFAATGAGIGAEIDEPKNVPVVDQ